MHKGENEDEMWDLYDSDRALTGKKHRRGDLLKPGEYHLVIHVCIFNSKNELLVQKRQPWKKGWSGMWDLTVGGSAVAGDSSQTAAERETEEELGLKIRLTGVRPYFTIHFDHGFDDYYLITQDVDLSTLSLQEEEVQAVKWVNQEEVLGMAERGEMIPYFFLDKIFAMKERNSARSEKDHTRVQDIE